MWLAAFWDVSRGRVGSTSGDLVCRCSLNPLTRMVTQPCPLLCKPQGKETFLLTEAGGKGWIWLFLTGSHAVFLPCAL
jgi:hypothetical protein